MPAPEEQLHVFLNNLHMGTLYRRAQGKLRFVYSQQYLQEGPGIPLSLSMPLAETEYDHDRISPFLWNLLPDNDQLLERWGARFHVSASNAFALLREIGEDCAGAIRFVKPDRLQQADEGGKEPLDESEIERRLRDLRKDPALSREPGDFGQFSLAGAQAKTALQKIGSQWYLPWGTEPTTHILKPPRPDLAGHVENEHFCLQLAERIGLQTAISEIARFGNETAIVVERYDRTQFQRKLVRVHQEDVCQALSVHPSRKYENAGGPGVPRIMALLNQSSEPLLDRDRFIEAVLFNYIILASDAHAKNYSLLLGTDGRVRLAPLYDIASVLPYLSRPRDLRLAMRVGRSYRDDQIRPHHFDQMARQSEYPISKLRDTMNNFLQNVPDASKTLRSELRASDIDHPVLDALHEQISARCRDLRMRFNI